MPDRKDHNATARTLLEDAEQSDICEDCRDYLVARAQVHATLAVAEAIERFYLNTSWKDSL